MFDGLGVDVNFLPVGVSTPYLEHLSDCRLSAHSSAHSSPYNSAHNSPRFDEDEKVQDFAKEHFSHPALSGGRSAPSPKRQTPSLFGSSSAVVVSRKRQPKTKQPRQSNKSHKGTSFRYFAHSPEVSSADEGESEGDDLLSTFHEHFFRTQSVQGARRARTPSPPRVIKKRSSLPSTQYQLPTVAVSRNPRPKLQQSVSVQQRQKLRKHDKGFVMQGIRQKIGDGHPFEAAALISQLKGRSSRKEGKALLQEMYGALEGMHKGCIQAMEQVKKEHIQERTSTSCVSHCIQTRIARVSKELFEVQEALANLRQQRESLG